MHRSICLELEKFIEKISAVVPSIESGRPRCSSGIKLLCTLQLTIDKAKLLVQHCCETSKLYLAITADQTVSRCERIRGALLRTLRKVQNLVPPTLVREISEIVQHLRDAKFVVESWEDEAGHILLALLQKEISAADSGESAEIKAFGLAILKLNITSPVALKLERRSVQGLLDRLQGHESDFERTKILEYFLYLLRKYTDSIKEEGTTNSNQIRSVSGGPLSPNITERLQGRNQNRQAEIFPLTA